MNVTIEQRDILQQILESLRTKYAGYRICSISESWEESIKKALLEQGVWHGYYENASPLWEFELQKVAGDYKGPQKLSVSISPVFDVIFADIYPNVFFIEVGFKDFPERESRPKLYEAAGVAGTIWDVTYFYDAALKDL